MIKHNILIMGSGRIGITVATLLARTNDYNVILSDIQKPHKLIELYPNSIKFTTLDIKKPKNIINFIKQNNIESIVSCLPFYLTIKVAMIANQCNINYFDPTEDINTTNKVLALAKKNTATFAPQCGLAPGFISIAANALMNNFDKIENVKMRVGALTQNTSNSLNYSFTWSVDGVINEYIHPCSVIENGNKIEKPALGDLEEIIVDNYKYEAFHTSGGVGSLIDTYYGQVNNLDYKTMRYPGHCAKMSFILNDLKLRQNPKLAKEILENVIPHTEEDKVVIYVAIQGEQNGLFSEKTYSNTLYPIEIDGNKFSAIQMTTATAICTIIDLVVTEKKLSGIVKQEQVNINEFLSNRFGSYYKKCSINNKHQ
jgi:saccharopine dehydrogenase-like NADP-dependent oxidoreductase